MEWTNINGHMQYCQKTETNGHLWHKQVSYSSLYSHVLQCLHISIQIRLKLFVNLIFIVKVDSETPEMTSMASETKTEKNGSGKNFLLENFEIELII